MYRPEDIVVIECYITGYPNITANFIRNGELVVPDHNIQYSEVTGKPNYYQTIYRLEIKNGTSANIGIYHCMATDNTFNTQLRSNPVSVRKCQMLKMIFYDNIN